MSNKWIKIGKYDVAIWCNHSTTDICGNSPTVWRYFSNQYYGRCSAHARCEYAFNSLDQVKADIAMREL